ncbi:PKD domain-containing protein [Anaerolineales bacterium HSG25]|nr:PKD domain-containing protein [Anaerolineales bacterium HSG25]
MKNQIVIKLCTAVIAALIMMVSMMLLPTATQAQSYDCSTDQDELPVSECEALVALYTSTNGSSWGNNENWLQADKTPCSWYGVACTNGHVNRLILEDKNLTGPIPPELGDMTSLTMLHLYQNNLTGPIPSELGGMTSLTDLRMQENQLTGGIPSDIDGMTSLTTLLLNDNQLTEGIPDELYNLVDLQYLSLRNNQLTGTISSKIGQLPKLLGLSLSTNQLEGELPTEITTLTDIQRLQISSNSFTGTFPAIQNLTALTHLHLDKNKLSGSIPSTIGNLTELTELLLDNNSFGGDIPSEIMLLTKIPGDKLSLDNNKFIIPTDATLRKFLSDNNFNWEETQTTPPSNLQATHQPDNSVQVGWTAIDYQTDGGYYEVAYALSATGPYTIHGQTTDKTATSYSLTDLPLGDDYYVVVRSHTPAHGDQKSNLTSDDGQAVSVRIPNTTITGLTASNDGPGDITQAMLLSAQITAGSNVTYTWQVQGQTKLGPTISHTFGISNSYVITVTANNQDSQAVASTTVVIDERFINGLTVSNNSPALTGTVTLTAQISSGAGVSYLWNFGDSSSLTATGKVVSHTYNQVGVYTATVTARNAYSNVVAKTAVKIKDVSISDLTVTHDGPTEIGQATLFSATVGAGTNVNYAWDFGDTTDTGASTNHTYAKVGSYSVVVTASNSTNTVSKTVIVPVEDVPVKGLTMTNSGATIIAEPMFFTVSITSGTNVGYLWEFGDGASMTSTTVSVSHTYTQIGSYDVKVIAENSTNSMIEQLTAVVSDQALVGLMAENDSPTKLGQTTMLTASGTTGTNIQYTWDLGDGTTATGAVVSHTYQNAGSYTANVMASNSANLITTTTMVTIVGDPVLSIRKIGPTEANAGQHVTYTLTVSNTGTDKATGLIISDILPDGAVYIRGADTVENGIAKWNISMLAKGATETVFMVVTATQSITNQDYGVIAGDYQASGTEKVFTKIDPTVTKTVIDLADGGTAEATDGTVQLTLPPQVHDKELTIILTTAHTTSHPISGYNFGERAFEVTAHDGSQDVTQFDKVISLTIEYNPADLGDIDPSTLAPYVWRDDSGWQALCEEAETTCEHDQSNNRFIIGLKHLSEFILLAPEGTQVYLPVVVR